MADLRRRVFGSSAYRDASRTPSPVPSSGTQDTISVSAAKAEQINKQLSKSAKVPGTKRRNLWLFSLGGIFGVFVALFFAAGRNDVIDLAYLKHLNLDSLMEVLPAGLVKDAEALQVSMAAPRSLSFAPFLFC